MPQVFLSHSSADDALVRRLQQALADLGEDLWIDSRELRGGDALWPAIQSAIESAAAFAVLVSPDGLQSRWVGKELRHALDVQSRRGRAGYPVIPLTVDDTRLGVLEGYFEDAPAYIPISSAPDGLDAALDAILTALGRRLPADRAPTAQPAPEPVEELVLELSDLRFEDLGAGVRRPCARARLVHEPAAAGAREVASARSWRLTAPIGPIEADDIRWYLEKYAVWPGTQFRDRARRVEESLIRWGQDLHRAALPPEHTANVMQSWSRIADGAGRRCSILVDAEATLEAGATQDQVRSAREAATALLGLPWELLHDGTGFLFQGGKPVRVRRRLPNTRVLDLPLLSPPIRCLLVSPRPEDDACGYIDHRVSALALVEAMEGLGGLVDITVLSPPTLGTLREELERARQAGTPYQVVHFDGHGVYDRQAGLGGLCFEDPADSDRLEGRRHQTVYTDTLGPLLRDHRIPLVFLEACQSAQAEQASESVASELLKVGVASVVAMSHSVLVETARRFVAAFYESLAAGRRIGQAMLAGQRALGDDDFRGRVFGAGELRLKDWFVPVLYQEREDPALFTRTPAPRTREDLAARLQARLGDLPAAPPTGFVGRSRELLALERLLRPARRGLPRERRWALIRGQAARARPPWPASSGAGWCAPARSTAPPSARSSATASPPPFSTPWAGNSSETGTAPPPSPTWTRRASRSSGYSKSARRCWSSTTWRASCPRPFSPPRPRRPSPRSGRRPPPRSWTCARTCSGRARPASSSPAARPCRRPSTTRPTGANSGAWPRWTRCASSSGCWTWRGPAGMPTPPGRRSSHWSRRCMVMRGHWRCSHPACAQRGRRAPASCSSR